MVTGAVDTIELKLVVDKAEMEQQLGQALTATGPPSGGAGPSKGGIPVEPGVRMSKSLGMLAKLGGIAFGITALVKGSKVMSTTMGAFSTVMGAMVDVFLAPLMVQLLPVLEKLAKWIPTAQGAGEIVADLVSGLSKSIAESVTNALHALGLGPPPPSKPDPRWPDQPVPERTRLQSAKSLGETLKEVIPMLMSPQHAVYKAYQYVTRPKDYAGEFEPKVKSLGEGQFMPEFLEKLLTWNDAQLTRFLELRADRPNVNIEVNADNIEDIMSQVRDEVQNVMRDERSRGFQGG